MKKLIAWVTVLGILTLGPLYFAKTRGIRISTLFPWLSFPRKSIKQYLPQGYQSNYPFRIPKGVQMRIFADLGSGLPRVMAFDPQGVLIVSLTNKGKVVALPDVDKNKSADEVIEVLSGLNRPHGLAFDGYKLYVAETNRVVRYDYSPADFSASNPEVVLELPSGGRHFTRTIRIYNNKLYTSVGSSCDVCLENDWRRASILVSDLDGSNLKTFASGLRNTVFFTFDSSGRMWGTEMGRDFLGDNLPPDELNIIEEGKDYGWPYCYGDKIRDTKFKTGEQTTYCLETQSPAYNFPAHVAPLGLTFIDSKLFGPQEQGNLLVDLHGSWNASNLVGYKIVKLSVFAGGTSEAKDFITGFLRDEEVLGRPVDLIFDEDGNLYISDDEAGLIYIIIRD